MNTKNLMKNMKQKNEKKNMNHLASLLDNYEII